MKTDSYTRVILRAIAFLLAVCAMRLPVVPVEAQSAATSLQFDPEIRQIELPNQAAAVLGRMAIGTITGNIYGFPTDGWPYPKNTQNSDLAVSKPILLGRFDVGNLPQK